MKCPVVIKIMASPITLVYNNNWDVYSWFKHWYIAGEWPGNEILLQAQPAYDHQVTKSSASIIHGGPIVTGHPAMMQVVATTPIVPPPPDIQPIIDKLANYVAKNGHDFENTIKAKNDPRFSFVHPWNGHHRYYLYKKQLCVEQIERERRTAAIVKGTKTNHKLYSCL